MVDSCALARVKLRAFVRAFFTVGSLSLTAHAGHAPLVPEPRTILLRESHPEHIVIGTRRGGYFVTQDAGKTWSWMCEAGVGYDDEEVYPGVLLANGTLAVSTGFGGVSVSRDGCGFSQWLPSERPFVADVRLASDDSVLALEARTDGASYVNRLWQSADGLAWRELGQPFAPDAQATSFAKSDAGALYVGVSSPTGSELLRSSDASSWERIQVSAEPGATLRVVGVVGAAETARVFLIEDYAQTDGLTTRGDRALLSVDGGRTFSLMLEASGDLSSWSLSTDGSRLAVGGHNDGIYVLQDAAQVAAGTPLARVSTRPVHALAWDSAGQLYAAGHEASDGFSVGVSADEGRTFRPLFALCQVQGPPACAPDSSIGSQCQNTGETGWDVRKEVAASTACSADGRLTASAGSAGSATPSGTAEASRGAATLTEPDDTEPGDAEPGARTPSGSSCAYAPTRERSGWLALLMLGGVLALRGRLRA